jgi:hypothetical protein
MADTVGLGPPLQEDLSERLEALFEYRNKKLYHGFKKGVGSLLLIIHKKFGFKGLWRVVLCRSRRLGPSGWRSALA